MRKVPIRVAGFFAGDPLPEQPDLHEQFDIVMQYFAKLGAQMQAYDVSKYLKKLYNAKKSKEFGSKGAEYLARRVMWADIVIIASPVHWSGLPMFGHAFVHHVLSPLEWGGRTGGGYECSGKTFGSMFTYHEMGAAMAGSHVHFVVNHMKMDSPGWSAHCFNKDIPSEDGWQKNPRLMARALFEHAMRTRNSPSAAELDRMVERDMEKMGLK